MTDDLAPWPRRSGRRRKANGSSRTTTVGCSSVAAHSKEEAREVLTEADLSYEVEDIDGDGWKPLDMDYVVRDEDGEVHGTVADIFSESPEPRHLWSCEP